MKLVYTKIFLLIGLSLLSVRVLSVNDIDSLKKITRTSTNNSLIAKCYFELGVLKKSSNPLLALDYFNKSISLKQQSASLTNECYFKIIEIFKSIGALDSASFYTNILHTQALKTNNTNLLNSCYNSYGTIYLQKGDHQKAIEYFKKELEYIKNNNNNSKCANLYNNLGSAYAQGGNVILAKEYFFKSITINTNNNDLSNLASQYNNIGIIYAMSGQLDSSYVFLKKGLVLRIKKADLLGIGGSYNNLAQWHIENKEYNKAKSLLDSAYIIAKNNSLKKLEKDVYDNYELLYTKQGEYKLAYEFLNKKQATQKKIDKENISNNIAQLEARVENEKQQTQLLEKDLTLTKVKNQNQNQTIFIVAGLVLFLMLAFVTFLINKSLRANKRKNNIINEQKQEVENQNRIINEKHKDITDSIKYAHRIQSSLIPSQKDINKQYEKIAVWFQPRDIVSGDFYWYSKHKQIHVLALADCTGHGVPGAFMSIIGINYLNAVVTEKGITQPNLILQELKKGVISSLNPNQIDEVEKKDGMDVALICFNENELHFSGANQSVLILRNYELIELKGNRQPIGLSDNNEQFDLITQSLLKGDRIILYSDGVVDQFGGENEKKLKSKQFKKWLIETAPLSYNEQTEVITKKVNDYKNEQEQTDDITLIILEI